MKVNTSDLGAGQYKQGIQYVKYIETLGNLCIKMWVAMAHSHIKLSKELTRDPAENQDFAMWPFMLQSE
jgi:hypothetical protein